MGWEKYYGDSEQWSTADQDYVDALKAHHAVMQAAMKAKQTMNPAACDTLDHVLVDFAKMYIKE